MVALIVPGVVVLFGLIFGGALSFFAIKARNRLKLIEAAPMCKADELITGLAKMKGKIVAVDEEDLLTSPMSKTVCVYFRFLVQEERTRTVTSYQNGRNVTRTERYWHTVVDDIQAVPSAVQDKTGEAMVELREAELTLEAMQATSGTFNSLPANLERMLQKRYGVSGKGLIFNKNMRYTETTLEPGAKVFVVGDCKIKKSGTACFYKGDDPLLITDKNEEELVGHFKKRFYGFGISAIAMPLLMCILAAVIGFFIWKQEHPQKKAELSPSRPVAEVILS
jgi:hypothetical protein